jgi:hypothetical protein
MKQETVNLLAEIKADGLTIKRRANEAIDGYFTISETKTIISKYLKRIQKTLDQIQEN